MTDVNYRAQYHIEYTCSSCGASITISTLRTDLKSVIEINCPKCGTLKNFKQVKIVSKTPGIFNTKCWNCGASLSNRNNKRDGWKGLICHNCGKSLRSYKNGN